MDKSWRPTRTWSTEIKILILIYLSTAIGLTPGGSTHLHINNTENITINNKTTRVTNKTTQITNLEGCWPCPVFANCTLAFALQLREKHGKTSVRVAEEIQSWVDGVEEDARKLAGRNWLAAAKGRGRWRHLFEEAKAKPGL
jgi:hypothetical protein